MPLVLEGASAQCGRFQTGDCLAVPFFAWNHREVLIAMEVSKKALKAAWDEVRPAHASGTGQCWGRYGSTPRFQIDPFACQPSFVPAWNLPFFPTQRTAYSTPADWSANLSFVQESRLGVQINPVNIHHPHGLKHALVTTAFSQSDANRRQDSIIVVITRAARLYRKLQLQDTIALVGA
jgi:hypothetical protein